MEPPLELVEEVPLQVQMQVMEAMEDGEALVAEEGAEAMVALVYIIQFLANQEEMGVVVELAVMEAAAERGAEEGGLLITLQGQEVQEILAVLEEEAEAAEMLGQLQVLMEEAVMVVMVQQEAMAEAEGVAATAVPTIMAAALLALAALVALD